MSEHYNELIDQYNLGKLSGEELARFESELARDPVLAETVRTRRAAWEMQEMLAEELLRANIRARFAAQPDSDADKPGPKNWFPPNWIIIGVAILLLGVASLWYVWRQPADQPLQAPQNAPNEIQKQDNTPDTQQPVAQDNSRPETPQRPALRQIAQANYRIPDGLTGIRGASDDDTLALATTAFFDKKYRLTTTLLTRLPDNDAQEALSLRAHAHFLLGNFPAAARDFSALEQGGIYRREAEWYGLLAQMCLPNANQAALAKQLDKIRKQANHPYQAAAAQLWKELQ